MEHLALAEPQDGTLQHMNKATTVAQVDLTQLAKACGDKVQDFTTTIAHLHSITDSGTQQANNPVNHGCTSLGQNCSA
eukprot:9522046-Lingulodinium_polyedra.AAC.1